MGEQQTSRQIIGSRIRERREAAGISQGELAKRVYVARQTVNNWETGKTLIDVQSLVLVAEALGISASELLGERGVEAVRAEAEDRHKLIVLLGAFFLVYLTYFVSLAIRIAVGSTLDEGPRLVLVVVTGVSALLSGAGWYLIGRFMRTHDLRTAARLVAFLEGRDPAEALPNSFFYTWILPAWGIWWRLVLVALFLLVMVVTL